MDRQKEKELLNLSGEFRVASELLRRNIFCSVTYGNSKGTDIIIFNPKTKESRIVEVKTTSSKLFITSFYQKYKTEDQCFPDYWVLYYQGKLEAADDEFYIFTHKELAGEQAIRNKSVDKSWKERGELHAKGVDNVLKKDISKYLNDWGKIKL